MESRTSMLSERSNSLKYQCNTEAIVGYTLCKMRVAKVLSHLHRGLNISVKLELPTMWEWRTVLSRWPRDPIRSVKLMLGIVGDSLKLMLPILNEWQVLYQSDPRKGTNSECKTEASYSERPILRVDSKSVLSQWPRGLILSPRMEVITRTSPHIA